MILSPYALLLLVLLCSEVVGKGHKKHRGRSDAHGLPVDRAQSQASPQDHLTGQQLAAMTGISLLAERRASLKDLMNLETEYKSVNKLSSDIWPPKVGGVYFTELRNMGLSQRNTPHPVVVMGPADPMFTTTEKCVLVLEISHKMPMEDKYTTPLTELFPKETRIFVDPNKHGDLEGSINSAVYRIVQANKFVLLPPINNDLVVMSKDNVEKLKKSVAESDYPENKKFYPDWVFSNNKGKGFKPQPQILLYIHRRMDLLEYLFGKKGERST